MMMRIKAVTRSLHSKENNFITSYKLNNCDTKRHIIKVKGKCVTKYGLQVARFWLNSFMFLFFSVISVALCEKLLLSISILFTAYVINSCNQTRYLYNIF